jgi:hypothetical protein
VLITFTLSVLLSVRKYQRSSDWTVFREIGYSGLLQKICREIAHLVKIGQKYRKYFVARKHCKGNQLLHFHGNTEHFYIADNYMLVNNNTKGTYYCVSIQQWLHERATVLSYTYSGYLFIFLQAGSERARIKQAVTY